MYYFRLVIYSATLFSIISCKTVNNSELLGRGKPKPLRDNSEGPLSVRVKRDIEALVIPRGDRPDRSPFRILRGLVDGWTCDSWVTAQFTELMKNPDRNEERVIQDAKSQFQFYSKIVGFDQGYDAARLSFSRDTILRSPMLEVELEERCQKQETEMTYKSVYNFSEDKYENEWVSETVTKTKYIKYNCEFPDAFNIEKGATKKLHCRANRSEHGSWNYSNSYWRPFLRQQVEFDVILTNVGETEHVFASNCAENDDPKAILFRLEQGVKKWPGENDFIFTVQFDDDYKVQIPSSRGFISEDILYCPKRESINVSLSAIEDDVFFDDHYELSDNSDGQFNVKENGKAHYLMLTRKTWFGYNWTNELSVKASLIQPL